MLTDTNKASKNEQRVCSVDNRRCASSRCNKCRTRSQVLVRCGQVRRRSIVNSRFECKHKVQYPGVSGEDLGALELHLLQFAGIPNSQLCTCLRIHAIAWGRILYVWRSEFDACSRWMVLEFVDCLFDLCKSHPLGALS